MLLVLPLIWILSVVLGCYVLFHLVFFLMFEKILFQSTVLEQAYDFDLEVPFEELFIDVNGGSIHGVRLQVGSPKGLILYFHGNRGDLSKWALVGQELLKYGHDILMIDYRGYGKSTGLRSEHNLYQDAEAVYDFAQSHYNYAHITVFGRSLGSAVATHLASKKRMDCLILETPMSSLKEVVGRFYDFILLKSLIKYHLNSIGRINQVQCPIYVFHGTADQVVPFYSGERLFQAIEQNSKKMIVIRNGKHNNLSSFAAYQQAMEQILK
mgnify:CR=1 FL=1